MTPKKTRSAGKTRSGRRTRDALRLIARDVGKDRTFRPLVEEEKLNVQVAQMIYDERTGALLTQKKLADLVGTTQPVIARLEDADYEGHSLSMLRRIAAALNKDIEIRFAPRTGARKPSRRRRTPRKAR